MYDIRKKNERNLLPAGGYNGLHDSDKGCNYLSTR